MLASVFELPKVFYDALRDPLALFGFCGQFTFAARFIVQWIASERKRRSYVPVVFWYLSLIGGTMLFIYAYKRKDAVIMSGQALASFIYLRNLMLIYRRKYLRRRVAAQRSGSAKMGGPSDGKVDLPIE